MDTWTVQAGYPVIHVVRDYAAKTAKISQVSRVLLAASIFISQFANKVKIEVKRAENLIKF